MRNMPIRAGDQRPGRSQRSRRSGPGRLALAFVLVLLVASIFGVLGFSSAYYIHKTINRAAVQAAKAVANPSIYESGDELLYGTATGNLTASSVFANFVAPVLESAHLDPKQVTKYSEQVTWLDPENPKPQCGVIVYFEYPYALHVPFTHAKLTLIRLKAAAQMPKQTKSAGTCS